MTKSENFVISTFYKFVDLLDYIDIQPEIKGFCLKNNILGTILLAEEGINATICGLRSDIELFYNFIKQYKAFSNLKYHETAADFVPFRRMRVRLKKEIVVFRQDNLDINERGNYLDAKEWDKLISAPETLVIDTRNDYEYEVGSFKNATNPNTENFSDLADWVDKNIDSEDKEQPIAMFCTGGIRCEKSTAFLKNKGFKNVYHLKGGILGYLSETLNKDNLWQGDCFVFDDRHAVNKKLEPINK